MAEQQIDVESVDIEQLRDMANQQLEAEIANQPRNDKGQFIRKDWTDPEVSSEEEVSTSGETTEESEEQPPAAPQVFRRTIDLGDGAGVQVFEGASWEELVDKLSTAQTHATRKIREQAAELKQHSQENADNEFVLSQELLNKPTSTVKKMFEQMVGMPLDSFKSKVQQVEALQTAQAAAKAAKDFVDATPDYNDVEANGKKIGAYLKHNGLEWTVDNMQKAYRELSTDGLLVARPQAPSAENTGEGQTPQRIAEPARQQPQPTRKASSPISSKRSIPVVPKPKLTERDLYDMPEDQLRELANRELRGGPDPGVSY